VKVERQVVGERVVLVAAVAVARAEAVGVAEVVAVVAAFPMMDLVRRNPVEVAYLEEGMHNQQAATCAVEEVGIRLVHQREAEDIGKYHTLVAAVDTGVLEGIRVIAADVVVEQSSIDQQIIQITKRNKEHGSRSEGRQRRYQQNEF
jgi:hypothetical protein